jgi:hypothetical protein
VSDETFTAEEVAEVLRGHMASVAVAEILQDLQDLRPPVWRTPNYREPYGRLEYVDGAWYIGKAEMTRPQIEEWGLNIEPGEDAENFATFAAQVRDFLNRGLTATGTPSRRPERRVKWL